MEKRNEFNEEELEAKKKHIAYLRELNNKGLGTKYISYEDKKNKLSGKRKSIRTIK